MKIVVTGGAGFIGSAVIRHVLRATTWQVVNLDKLTYAGNLDSLREASQSDRYRFAKLDIGDRDGVARLLRAEQPKAILHLAAESHVDRSIDGPLPFIQTNIVGTYALLEATRAYWEELPAEERAAFRFHHVSTDEVFGSLGAAGHFTEASAYAPNSPYAASKAASDMLVRAWHKTFGVPTLTSNCSNNYGPRQFPEKLIPTAILAALEGRPIPIYGTGENVRDWLFVEDHARALLRILEHGVPGETYNVGGGTERSNSQLIALLCHVLDELLPDSARRPHHSLVHFVPDRPGHDHRYAIDAGKIARELGWHPTVSLEEGLRSTVSWYLANGWWVEGVRQHGFKAERIGTGSVRT